MEKYSLREAVPEQVRDALKVHPEFLQELLFYRGIKTHEDAELFLNPSYDEHLHDPFLMKGMEKAVKRILKAIKKNEHILIYTDYDCDGGPAGVLLHDFFKKIGYTNFKNYIPHRHNEGYGLNVGAVEQFAQESVTLLITADVGITDTKAVTCANKLGIDVIITDHHLPNGTLPPAYAILNSKQEDDTYPFDMLCGSGVAFKLVQALLARGDFDVKKGWEKWLLDMAGLATIADTVPLVGENRILAHYGLLVLRKSPRPGLQKLCRKMRVNQRSITEDDVGFMIAPRINAASRMGEPMEAFRMLTTDDEVLADQLSTHLNKLNDARKGVVASMAREIKKRLKAMDEIRDVVVIGNPDWKPALLGLAANSLVEEYKRPVFLWGKEGGGLIKGSCRSDASVNLVTLMEHAGDALLGFGGHALAGGFSVAHDKIYTLEEALVKSYRAVKNDDSALPVVMIDKYLDLDQVSWATYKVIERLAPFGIDNPKPVFQFSDIEVKGVRQFGRDNGHLELAFENSTAKKVLAIGFFTKPDQFKKSLKEGERVNLIANMEKSTFGGKIELRLRIIDVV